MRDGVFSITDGPALRILIDKNRNGVIDAGDVPMGGIVDLNGEATLPLLIEWKSTTEFGPLSDLQLYVGVQSGGGIDDRWGRVYAPKGHEPQSEGIASSNVVSSYVSNGRSYAAMADNYGIDPTGLLTVPIPAPGLSGLSGLAKVDLPIAAFEPSEKSKTPARLYVRAFAQTAQKNQSACWNNPIEVRKGACIRRYAFTNPVWAVPNPKGTKGCVLTPRSFDRDGDGIPDGCSRSWKRLARRQAGQKGLTSSACTPASRGRGTKRER